MVFWRKKKNEKQHEEEARDEKLLHPEGEPDLELPTEYDPDIDPDTKHELEETEAELVSELDEIPTPEETPSTLGEEIPDDADKGGWLSRLTSGLSKSSTKISKGLTDLVTKSKLDQETLDELEDILIEADLGPTTAAKVIEDFSKDRFGKDIEQDEIREALATSMETILAPVAHPLTITKPENGAPYVILVCGVNGAGKTTSIGKLAYQLHYGQQLKVMMAAGDTFRAAALEQLEEWAKRVGCICHTKEIGADAASVAFEAYQKAKEEDVDVLLIDTAGRLHNKANLMAELEKIIRVLKKQDETIPHATLLVLDATTGQNALAQVETFKDMVNITGLMVTKLDGSAKGGILVALADKFGVPVHKIGVGESIEDMQPFNAREYARALVGL